MANTIKIGNIEASAVMIGNSAVSAVYIGSSKIYPSGPTDYSKQYLTFKVIKGGNITITASNANVAKTIQYSTDNGSTWTSLTTSTTAQKLGGTLNVGDKVLVKGTNTTYGTSSNYNRFGGTAKVNVYGNIMSLISGDSFANNKTLTASYTFYRLFTNTNLLSAENLILPATTLATNCYNNMFRDCTSLTTAPELPATTLVNRCYQYMFSGCRSLNYIKCLATDISATNCTSSWLKGVASSGTFVKAASMTSWTTGVNGIPTGWTVQNDGVTTDNWVLVNNTFDKPRKIKVDYSLIEDDNTKIRGDYQFSFPSGYYFVSYLNEPTILNFSESSGWDYDTVMENYLGMVGVIDENGELAAILEDGVEYTQINHTSITEMGYIQAIGAGNNHYLYATE